MVRSCLPYEISHNYKVTDDFFHAIAEVLNEGLVLTGTSIGHHRVSVLQDSLNSALKLQDE